MRIKIWGARGSIPCPGPDTVRYGGNTSCVQTTLSDGTQLVLDAGTGIRNLKLPKGGGPIHILLTHLHRPLPAIPCATASRATCRRR